MVDGKLTPSPEMRGASLQFVRLPCSYLRSRKEALEWDSGDTEVGGGVRKKAAPPAS